MRTDIKYLYYFFNFLVLAILIFLVIGVAEMLDQAKHVKVTVVREQIDQGLAPDFIMSQIDQEQDTILLFAAGDVMLSRVVGQKMLKNGYDYPFAKVSTDIQFADIAFANLETAVLPGRVVETGEMMFRADPESVEAMAKAGFDIVSLANNHTPNYGDQGLIKTFEYLDKYGLDYVGAGRDFEEAHRPVIKEVKGIKLAFLAYNDSDVVPRTYSAGIDAPGTAFMNPETLKKDIEAIRDQVDLIIVSMHSGTEYIYTANNRQKEFAHAAVDFGADLIIGHHPHVVQEMEEYKGKYIFYSLGNFIFDQMWSEDTRHGGYLWMELNKSGVKQFYFAPVVINDYAQPELSYDPGILKETKERLGAGVYNKKLIYENGLFVLADAMIGAFPADEKQSNYRRIDLDGDRNVEWVYYDDNESRLYIVKDNQVDWSSSPDWQIEDFEVGNIDHSGNPDVVMSVWKKGSFGPDRPFWQEGDDESWGNHLFVFTYRDGRFEPLWQSSELSKANKDILIVDVDKERHETTNKPTGLELVVIEKASEEEEYLAVWRWDEWGFTNIWRSNLGDYNYLFNHRGDAFVK